MAANGYPLQNGALGRNGTYRMNGGTKDHSGILSVDQALPYSPFSSIAPFNPDIIPLPSIGLRSSVSIYANKEERDQGRQGLENLNREAQHPSSTTERLQKTLNELKELLRPEGIPEYKMKFAPKTQAESPALPKLSLTPVAQMLLDQINVKFTYPTPQTTVFPVPSTTPDPLRTQAKPKSGHSITNQEAHTINSSISIQIPTAKSALPLNTSENLITSQSRSTLQIVLPKFPSSSEQSQSTLSKPPKEPSISISQPTRPPQSAPISTSQPIHPHQSAATAPSGSNPSLAVIIPDLPADFRPQDYELLPESPDTPQHLSRKRQRSQLEEDSMTRSVDQREKADTAFRHFRDHLLEIFEAEDQLQPDTFPSSPWLTVANDGITLSKAAQSKVEPLLQKVISVGRFAQAPVDDLVRLQKLCETSLRDTETMDVKVDDTMGESEVDALIQQLSNAELGLRAARTSLRLMSGGREEKQIYSEEIIQAALNTFKNVTEGCVVPIVEMRSSGSSAAPFKLFSTHKKVINDVLTQCRRLLAILASLIGSVELSETVINTLEFTASQLIFVENAPIERESILGISKFDTLRVVAMDVLAKIFQNNPSQRRGIFDEILTSLERLPVTKQSARQFKLPEGGSIQLVSALIMRLIQTSACKRDDAKSKRRNKALESMDDELDADEPVENGDQPRTTITSESRAELQVVTAVQELKTTVLPLVESAKSDANYVVNYIVSRAMTSTKSGDTPYRNLLDLFVEDFIACLSSTDWPAAELLLRLLLFKMVQLAEGDKTPAPAKNMALDLLGSMGAAISELSSHLRKAAASVETGDGGLGSYLVRLAEASLDKRVVGSDLISWACGPFRATLEFLNERCTLDPHLASAMGFFMTEWASKISTNFDVLPDDESIEVEQEYGRLAFRLRNMIADPKWLSTEYSFDSVGILYARLAYSLTILNSPFCQSFGRVLTILLGSMTSEQATVRSKSLKSVNQVLDTDPTILDRETAVMRLILGCSNDPSVQVRDSALGLIGKCINLRPALEDEVLDKFLLPRINDSGVGVRKRAMKLAKDIYLRNQNAGVRSRIAGHLLHRVTDLDEGVQELARQTIEEVWMSPFYQPTSIDDTSAQFKIAMSDHVSLMIKTIQHSGVANVLDKVLHNMLIPTAKSAEANIRVCKALVATMFDTIIDNSAGVEGQTSSARDALRILEIFAKSNKDLFTPEQIHLLQPYIANVKGGEDLAIFRSVVIVFRHVLPKLSKAHNVFLVSTRNALLTTITRFSKGIVEDVVACLWIISEVLGDLRNLTTVVSSSIKGIRECNSIKLNDPANDRFLKKVCRLLTITGIIGKYCDLDPQCEAMRPSLPYWKDDSVAKLMSDTFAPFAQPSQPLEVRKAALGAIGMVCQTWPKNFRNANIRTTCLEVFQSKTVELEIILLRSFKEFLLLEEKRSEVGSEGPGAANDPTAKLGVMGGGHGDGVALGLAQEFLDFTKAISLRGMDEQALLAAEVIASITRQGLVHPKECGPTLIALETSPNTKIAEIAYREHRSSHEKHETILEKEYMTAIKMAYIYQRDIVRDTHGATLNPFTAKLHMMIDVLKISKVKNRKRFYENLCGRLEFPAKIDIETELPYHLDFAQFVIENMAFFEYATMDELFSAVSAMDKVVNSTGTSIQHAIETEVFHVSLDQPSQIDANGQIIQLQPEIDPIRLRQLTAISMMLSNLWAARTYLRRQYGLVTSQGKTKGVAKDLNRAPVRVQGVNADKFWEEIGATMSALESEEKMVTQCKAFVEVLSIDPDFKLAAEAEEELTGGRPETPSDNEDNEASGAPGSGRGRKRKAGGSTPGGRKKRARSSSVGPRSRGKPKGSGKRASVEKSDDGEQWE